MTLAPGETRRVEFSLSRQDLVFTGLDDLPVLELGDYHVWVGCNSADGLKGEFRLVG